MNEKEYFCIHLSGLVQGVGMRYYIRSIANELGVRGYVKNLLDGRVECIIKETPQKLEHFITLLYKAPRGRIDDITIKDFPGKEEFNSFTIRN